MHTHSQQHLVRLATALRDACLSEPYAYPRLGCDLIAGITVGIIAIPLAMALAIASGVAPQHGLYTAVIAGIVVALGGGSRYSVSGPTAAFVVILFPVAQRFGLGGLLMATMLSGVLLIMMALGRLGRLISYIPVQVTLGFTMGIGIVIATLQIKDFFGLPIAEMPEHYLDKLQLLVSQLPNLHWGDTLVGVTTLATLLLWPRLKPPVTGHLPAVLVGLAVAGLITLLGGEVATIGSRFSYTLANGVQGQGIPPLAPSLLWPWQWPGPDGQPMAWSLASLQQLLPAAFSMAMLGAIESLLCAVVLDGMTGSRHHSNGELLGQGLGNLIAPLFGGITATAAIARSAANVRAGATSPIAAVVHALVVLLALVLLAPWLSWLPLSAMAALLLLVAWNMSEAHKVWALLSTASRADVLVMLACMALTVLFDMVIAITAGVVLAALLFMREIARMTLLSDLASQRRWAAQIPAGWVAFKISGPLFFAAADRVFAELTSRCRGHQGVILLLDAVPVLDAGGLVALERFCETMRQAGTRLLLAELQFQPLKTLARAHFEPRAGELELVASLEEGLARLQAPPVAEPAAWHAAG